MKNSDKSKLPFSVAKHCGNETCGSEMSTIDHDSFIMHLAVEINKPAACLIH